MELKSLQEKFVTVYFSKDRPMQLDLVLTTNQKNCLEWENQEEVVLYKTSNQRFEDAYSKVMADHPSVRFLKETNFKKDLVKLLKDKEFVLFVVDDTIFLKKYSLDTAALLLDTIKNALGYSLRLGKNTDYCYPMRRPNFIPPLQVYSQNICQYDWTKVHTGDFGYPLEVSSSIYRVGDLLHLLKTSDYGSPNSLEWQLSLSLQKFRHLNMLLCCETSVAFANPVNKVQEENNNRFGGNPAYSQETLLELYEKGGTINPETFYEFVPNGCHQEMIFDIVYY